MPHSVLVVEDDESMRLLLSSILTDAGYVVDCAVDGADAIHKLRGPAPDLMFLDLLMPGISGWDVLEFVAERPRLSTIAVVVLTAYGDRQDLPSGCSVLHKPVDADLLLQLVREIVEQRASTAFEKEEGPSDLFPRRRTAPPHKPR